MLTFGSLFAGVGGFDLGFESAGYDCRFQVEWDKHCQQVLAHRWPNVPRWGDVSEVNGADLPPVDVITYGFPCQDLSVAGRRAGLDGERSHLFFEAVRIIREMREATDGRYPTWAVAENVAGLLNADGGHAMGRVVDELADAGAVVIEWTTLDAQHFGVPQRRRRVFIASCFNSATGDRCPDPLFPVGTSSSRDTQTSEEPRQGTTADAPQSFGISSRQVNGQVPFVKASRQLNAHTWDADRPSPTLNSFDVGEHRTTTAVVFDPQEPRQDVATDVGTSIAFSSGSIAGYSEGVGTLRAQGGDVGGGSEVLVADVVGPLTTHMGSPRGSETTDSHHVIPVVFDPSRRDGARIQDDTCNTLTGHMGTGGNNTPMVAQTIGFSHTQGIDCQPSTDAFPTLRREGNGMAAAIPIQDGREMEKHQNGLGVGADGDPAYTLDTTGGQAIAQPHVVAPTLTAANDPSRSPQSSEITQQIAAVVEASLSQCDLAVRRLTPVECERLMGWPDDHTLHRADGKTNADSSRYKMCGNGVVAPVAAWLAKHLAKTFG